MYLSDVGLLTSCYPPAVRMQLIEATPVREINNGALFENFVAQEIYAGCGESFYYKKKNIGEVDFMIEKNGAAVPIEVKSGADHKKHAALDHLLENHNLHSAYVLSTANVEVDGMITYLPIYMAGLLAEGEKTEDFIIPSFAPSQSNALQRSVPGKT